MASKIEIQQNIIYYTQHPINTRVYNNNNNNINENIIYEN